MALRQPAGGHPPAVEEIAIRIDDGARRLGSTVESLKVSSKSNPNSVAGAMAGVVRQLGAVEVQVVGAGALNQAIKAVAIARGYLRPSALDLICVPTFADIEIDGQSRTAIRLLIECRPVEAVDTAPIEPEICPVALP